MLDPRPGGRWSIDVNGRDVVEGAYLVVDPPRRIEFTWAWRGAPGADADHPSRVEITLLPDGDATVVVLRHHGLPADLRAGHESGWRHYLPRLCVAAAGGDPGPDALGTPETRHDGRSRPEP